MVSKTLDESAYRYERKFAVAALGRQQIEALVKTHPYLFVRAHPPRFVNNLYFDTPNHDFYLDNIDGQAERVKVRIRWYGALFGQIEQPRLELKLKSGVVGRKESYPLLPFQLVADISMDTVRAAVALSAIPDGLKMQLRSLQPSILNRYWRAYYESADREYRITIDSDVTHYRLLSCHNHFVHKVVDREHTIVELKYGLSADEHVAQITNYFPFRISRHSKYVAGIDRALGPATASGWRLRNPAP